jgi:leucyl-tRNA synthetase
MVNSSDELYENLKNGEKNIKTEFICDENGKYIVGREVEKCQIKYNVDSDAICNEYGADTRLYEMFFRTIEQENKQQVFLGFFGFLKKAVSFVFDEHAMIVDEVPTKTT